MKTFNSIFANGNVKSIIAIATVAISSVFGFTSCDKNDDGFNNAPVAQNSNQQAQQTLTAEAQNPVTVSDAYLYVAATPSQLKYIDATYTLSVDGQTKVIKLSDMNELKDAQRIPYTYTLTEGYDALPGEKENIKIFEFLLGKVKKARVESVRYTALSAKADKEITIYCGTDIKVGNNSFNEVSTRCYHDTDDIANVVDRLNED